MVLNTTYHGEKEYNKEDIIFFKKGLPGFGDMKNFIIFPVENNESFKVLHSLEDTNLGFVLISPFEVVKDYEFEINKDKLKELKVNSPGDVLVLNTVTLNSNSDNITTNLQAPIVINTKAKLGEQIILSDDRYLIKQPLFNKKTLSEER
ncbi:MAG: flagellar assembly protein FliW [Clostridiaceae bacterium]|nr:flagellar assembly protein FliW [Clostridiaceae bacterium]